MRARTIHKLAWLCLIGALPSIGFGLPMVKKDQSATGFVLCGLFVFLVATTIALARYSKKKFAEERRRESLF
jgi:hypothetical protein